ncbi:hypothetical protein F2Q70_00030108 [Brassica cretica]|uniref:Uncharacterized protein n=1 Tax=Brassica cretica TaxID=69181 RepID=A0A8S9FH98_BRACR|nr:hypothetical protein F2Q70_00030108 [Brassica cretica]
MVFKGRAILGLNRTTRDRNITLKAVHAYKSEVRPSPFSPGYFRVFPRCRGSLGRVHQWLSWPLGMNSGHLPSFLTICVCSQALEDALGDNITDQSHQKVGVGGSPGVPTTAQTCLPFIEEGAVTFSKVSPFRYHFWPLI